MVFFLFGLFIFHSPLNCGKKQVQWWSEFPLYEQLTRCNSCRRVRGQAILKEKLGQSFSDGLSWCSFKSLFYSLNCLLGLTIAWWMVWCWNYVFDSIFLCEISGKWGPIVGHYHLRKSVVCKHCSQCLNSFLWWHRQHYVCIEPLRRGIHDNKVSVSQVRSREIEMDASPRLSRPLPWVKWGWWRRALLSWHTRHFLTKCSHCKNKIVVLAKYLVTTVAWLSFLC